MAENGLFGFKSPQDVFQIWIFQAVLLTLLSNSK